jgi:hypothetical protein
MAEINDLSMSANIPIASTALLGLPPILWWLFAIAIGCTVVWWLAGRWDWLHDRLYEPSSHAALAAFFGLCGAYIDSLGLDPSPLGQALMLTGLFFAFLGLVTREGG